MQAWYVINSLPRNWGRFFYASFWAFFLRDSPQVFCNRLTYHLPMSELQARLSFAATTLDSDAEGGVVRFRGVAYSGGIIPGYGGFGDSVIDLADIDLPKEVLMLADHASDLASIAGRGRVWLDDGSIMLEGDLTQSTEAGRMIAGLLREGLPIQLSVGIDAAVEAGDPRTVTINSQDLTVSTVFRHPKLREVSFVPLGADPSTSVAIAASAANAATAQPPEELPAMSDDIETLRAELREAKDRAEAAEAHAADVEQLLNDAETELAEVKMAARREAVQALFAAVGREYSDEKAEPYLGMSAVAFAAVAADMREISTKNAAAPEHAFGRRYANESGEAAPRVRMIDTMRVNRA